MSRYEIDGTNPSHVVVVGWDNPLQTFFAHVTDAHLDEDDDGHMVLWLGGSRGEVASVEALMLALEGFAVIPPVVLRRLRVDHAGAKPPTPLQRTLGA